METFTEILTKIDDFVWGPVMLILLVGTGIFLTVRLQFYPWRNLGYALKSVLSKEARTKKRWEGDISPFSALMTALAATIGTGNIVGVATAMVLGGPEALVWMWISACFGLSSKFSECMLAIKYREVNEHGEMSGGPMYTMKHAFKNKTFGKVMGFLFALFTVLALLIIVGGIKSISKVSQVVVPSMAIFYVIGGIIVILGNITNLPQGLAEIFFMAFSFKSVAGGVGGTIMVSMMQSLRWGVARGVFS